LNSGTVAVSATTPVEMLLRRDRWLAGGALVIVVVLCWAWLVPMARTMEREGMMCGVASWAMVDTWELNHLAMLVAMWAVMMAGMMLPSAAPIVLLYAGVVRKSPGIERPSAHIYGFAAGYLVVWTLFSVGATVLQRIFTGWLLLSPTMASESPIFGGVMLIIAGAYQMTPLKQACLAWCRSPVDFLTRFWKPGISGGFRLGMAHGLFCLGCCWALMLLLFVGGVMNLWWIAALTIFVLLEKLTPIGGRGARWLGVVPILIGGWMLVRL
jgi:predicted metal-binding membrane protein